MSQTKELYVAKGTTVRWDVDGGDYRGSGGNDYLYAGRHGSHYYRSYLQFTMDWANVGAIESAVLHLFTSDGGGAMPLTTTESPHVSIYRLTSSFSEETNDDSFVLADWTTASKTGTGFVTKNCSEAAYADNQINITAIVRAWAPAKVAGGGKATNHGIMIMGATSSGHNAHFFSEDTSQSEYRPYITLTYKYGPTAPLAPSAMSPEGNVTSLTTFDGTFSDIDSEDTMTHSEVEVYDEGHDLGYSGYYARESNDYVYDAAHGLQNGDIIYFTTLSGGAGLSTFTAYYVRDRSTNYFKVSATLGGSAVNITEDYTAGSWSKRIYSFKQECTNTEVVNGAFTHVPVDLSLARNTTYRWRARCHDAEAAGTWSALITFSVTNVAPNAPTSLDPASGVYKDTLDNQKFSGTFTDDDASDTMSAVQIQMSEYASGDAHWLDADFLLWDTGKIPYLAENGGTWEVLYRGPGLDIGTYYWRARHWDEHDTVSPWTYCVINVSADFEVEPGLQDYVQLRPSAAWRIVIKDMAADRGPGNVVAIFENAKNVGASKMYNSPGEMHFTLAADDPQISVVEPRQTHYSIQFYSGDGWREVFAGLVMDFDATETDVVFYGTDYLGLWASIYDERYDPAEPDLPTTKGGSKYVEKTISYIVDEQLDRAKVLENSPVGFITVGSIATMSETVTIYSTYQPVLSFITGLLESHKAGTGKRTRLYVRQKSTGGYEVVVADDPGVSRDNLTLRYGELVQGYRVVAFGQDWSSRLLAVGRTRDGIRVLYKNRAAAGIDEETWGRFARAEMVDGVSDENDLERRTKQMAIKFGKLGKQMGVAVRTGVLQPNDGYDICDYFPIDIQHGSVNTNSFGSGYWACYGITWECNDKGQESTTLTLVPREDTEEPETDLLTAQEYSPQDEWQVGWVPPDPIQNTSHYYLDQSTGDVYVRDDEGNWTLYAAASAPDTPTGLALTSVAHVNDDGQVVVDLTASLTQPTSTGLSASYVQITRVSGSYSSSILLTIPSDESSVTWHNAQGNTTYYARCWAMDSHGRSSDYSDEYGPYTTVTAVLSAGTNLIKNSSFALSTYSSVTETEHDWTLQADWNASRVGSDTNITTGTGSLTMTGVSY